jgi:fatty acid desaturase
LPTSNKWMIAQTWVLLALLGATAAVIPLGGAVFVILQGCWLHRLYTAGHESVHRKLLPDQPLWNDVIGQLLLLPIFVPLRVYRKIHAFHHAWNRRDEHTSALDTWVFEKPTAVRRGVAWAGWLASVYLGGWFLHSLASMLILIVLPPPVARRIHVAFRGWTGRDQLEAIAVFAAGIALHVAVAATFGIRAWSMALGWPLLVFAWVYSALVYIYHYRTGYGPATRTHARSIAAHPVFSWWLLNFNEHATHHRDPTVPWHRLPAARQAAGDIREDRGVLSAVIDQLGGPVIVGRSRRGDGAETPGESR